MKRALLALLLLAGPVLADERILRYEQAVSIQPSGELLVSEEITVRSEAQRIRHGIYRDLPVDYAAPGSEAGFGRVLRWRTPLKFLAAERDGQPEPWFSKPGEDGQRRHYLGAKTVLLQPGTYRYTLRYRYDRILKFLPDHDELYWNVTGNGWDFPMDAVRATVRLPKDPGAALRLEAYTGPRGAQGRDYDAQDLGGGLAAFKLTRALGEHEGLTIVVGWPKGVIAPPGLLRRLSWLLNDWREALLAALGVTLCFTLLMGYWMRYGADPAPRPLVPLFQPPRGLPPAALRYLDERGADNVGLSATLIQMAVQGRVRLEKVKKDWVLRRLEGKAADNLEGALDRDLWSLRKSVDTGAESDKPSFRSAQIHHSAVAMGDYKADVQMNFKRQGICWAVAALLLALNAAWTADPARALVFGGFVLLASAVSAGLLAAALSSLRLGRLGVLWGPFIGTAFGGLLAGGLSLGLAAGLGFGAAMPWQALQALCCGGLLGAFVVWMPRPSEDLQRLRDEIAGFTHYLSIAEQERLERLNPPERTPQLFERYLPYALALGVANQWCKGFEKILAAAMAAGAYAPLWYTGPDFGRGMRGSDFGRFSDGLSKGLASSVGSASAPPPSSGGSGFSGGGGGGSSGGGGGGGGGGGW